MYLPGARLFEGGHESAGVNAASKRWFLAEGATGSFFECYVLLSNPNPTPANVTLTYLLSDGTTIPQNIVLPANSRRTINVEHDVDTRLAAADVSTTVVSDIGIVVERAMYWPDISVGWREAHNSFGVTQSALRWGVADGRIGGSRDYQTYILLANPNPLPAEVAGALPEAGLHGDAHLHADPVQPPQHLGEQRRAGAGRGHLQRGRAGAELSADRGREGTLLVGRWRGLRRRHERDSDADAAAVTSSAATTASHAPRRRR